MKDVNVLVLGVGGNVSQGIIKALRDMELKVNIHGACISDITAGYLMSDSWERSPSSDSEDFLSWLLLCIKKKNINIILTGVEEIITKLDSIKDEISKHTNAIFVTPGYETIRIGADKLKTVEWLEINKLNFPKYCKRNDQACFDYIEEITNYPLIAKPKVGKASIGVNLVQSRQDLDKYIGDEEYLIQECIGDAHSEYTVGCYLSKENQFYCIIMRRYLQNGKTVYAEVVDDKTIYDECNKICLALGSYGSINIQLRVSRDGLPITFEINTRLSGTTAMRSKFGFNDVKALILEYVLNLPLDDCFNIRSGKAYRFDSELYEFDNKSR